MTPDPLHRASFRLSPEQLRDCRIASAKTGMTLPEWIKNAILIELTNPRVTGTLKVANDETAISG